jgi:hypothetical protein
MYGGASNYEEGYAMFRNDGTLSHNFGRFTICLFFLSAVWIFGLLAGLCSISVSPASVFYVMYSPLNNALTLTGLLLTQTFPLIISCIIYRSEKLFLILPVVFLKAFSFLYCTLGVVIAYADAGWMMRYLILFSDSCVVVLLLWFWIRNFTGREVCFFRDFLICLSTVIVICLVDYFVIYPLFLRLTDFF